MSGAPEQPEPVRRLSTTEVARTLLAGRSGSAADRSSVRLTRNARGETQLEVVVGAGEEGLESVDAVADKAAAIYDQLRGRYPLGSDKDAGAGFVGVEGGEADA